MKLSYTTYRLKCTHSFGISRSSYNHYDRVFIYLVQDGFVGRGEAAPSERYNESVPQIIEILKNKIVLPDNVADIDEIIDILDQHTNNIKSLRSACVNALFDWWTQREKQSVYEFFNVNNEIEIPTSFTIAIGGVGELENKIQEAKQYNILKVKLGTDNDKGIIKEIRKYTDKPIHVDANEGWDLETAIGMSRWLAIQNIELIEQPLPVKNLHEMSELKNHSPIPLIADENCHTSVDIENLVDGFDGINIKLAKSGGLNEAVKMIDIAKNKGLKVMLGCMVESSIGITAIAQLASQADYLDLDGNLLINNDPYNGLQIVNGVPNLLTGNGIGVNLKHEYQKEYPDLK